MRTVFQVAEPGFEGWRVVFADGLAVGDDGGFAANGGPFAGGVQEGNVDFGVGLQVVGFAGFGVGVEEEVEAATFLHDSTEVRQVKKLERDIQGLEPDEGYGGNRTFAAKAMQREVSRPLLPMRVVIMPNLQEVMKLVRSSTFSLSSGSFLLVALYLHLVSYCPGLMGLHVSYGSAGLSSGTWALLKPEDILDIV